MATRCCGVTATGNGLGGDWNNIRALGTSWTRGDVYYLRDGSYGSKAFNTGNSGSTLITIKKATATDHVTETGWQASYANQAVFTKWTVTTDYWMFDGQVRDSDWRSRAVSNYGIKVAGVQPLRLDNGSGTGCDNSTFRYVDFEGGGRDSGQHDDVVYGLASHQNLTFQYCALHDCDRCTFLMRGQWQNLLVEYCYMGLNNSTELHGELVSDVGSDGCIFRYNVIYDICGSGIWCVMNGNETNSKDASVTASGWKIYGNVIHWPLVQDVFCYCLIYVSNAGDQFNWADNWTVVNNTIVANGYAIEMEMMRIQAGSGNVFKNNLLYRLADVTNYNITMDYNWYYGSAKDGGANSEVGSGDPFVSLAGDNFHLSGNNRPSAADATIGTEYGTDPDGVSRSALWDRGAYEYDTSAPPVGTPVLSVR